MERGIDALTLTIDGKEKTFGDHNDKQFEQDFVLKTEPLRTSPNAAPRLQMKTKLTNKHNIKVSILISSFKAKFKYLFRIIVSIKLIE